MRFWIPLLAIEALAMWLMFRPRATDDIDKAQGKNFGLVFVGAIVLACDLFTLIWRNW